MRFNDEYHGNTDEYQGKAKDNKRACMDLKKMGIMKELHLILNGDKCGPMRLLYNVCWWKKELMWMVEVTKFLDGITSNISLCVNINDCKIQSMNSHDSHFFIAVTTVGNMKIFAKGRLQCIDWAEFIF